MYEIPDQEKFPPFRRLFFALEQARPDRAALMTRHVLAELNLPYDIAQRLEQFAYELLLNAYQHTTGVDLARVGDEPLPRNIRLEVGTVDVRGTTRVRVAVYDRGDLRDFHWSSARRGLTSIRDYAHEYGCEAASPYGKVVWAQI